MQRRQAERASQHLRRFGAVPRSPRPRDQCAGANADTHEHSLEREEEPMPGGRGGHRARPERPDDLHIREAHRRLQQVGDHARPRQLPNTGLGSCRGLQRICLCMGQRNTSGLNRAAAVLHDAQHAPCARTPHFQLISRSRAALAVYAIEPHDASPHSFHARAARQRLRSGASRSLGCSSCAPCRPRHRR